jgi:thiol-disulfide isomerase/thioredoxin
VESRGTSFSLNQYQLAPSVLATENNRPSRPVPAMSSVSTKGNPPHALLLVGPGCPYCAQMLEGLGELVKEGVIGELTVVNVEREPAVAKQNGVRSVPWARVGEFVLEGAHTSGELRHWVEECVDPSGMTHYLDERLQHGGLARVELMIREKPSRLLDLVSLIENSETAIQTRVGIGALLEGLEGTGLARRLVPELARLSGHADARVRADACHYLGLTEDASAIETLTPRLKDSDDEVREIAAESIEHLRQGEPDSPGK